MPVPIPDLRLDDDGMSCTLSFNRAPFFCGVPWSSVFAMVGEDGRGMVWPDDVPAEVARQAQGRAADNASRKEPAKLSAAREPKADSQKPRRARKRPALAAVPGGDDGAASRPAKSASLDRSAGLPTRAVIAPAPSSRPNNSTARKKRELPPYLRVVK
ncbi:MAG TPA: hypothetical protein VGY54_27940 [Polyangiaceae bacterium]|nr:hypothetical protein [Polyangiaceae bacterium]